MTLSEIQHHVRDINRFGCATVLMSKRFERHLFNSGQLPKASDVGDELRADVIVCDDLHNDIIILDSKLARRLPDSIFSNNNS